MTLKERILHLCTECIQKPNGVNLEEGVYRARSCLKVLKDMLREELDDIHKCIGTRHAVLYKLMF